MSADEAPATQSKPTSYDQVAIIGDVGGHSAVLGQLLQELGVGLGGDTSSHGSTWAEVEISWPDGLHVISVGDLVHRGPDSAGVVSLVDRLLELGHWTQLIGNHEAYEVHRKVFKWPEELEPDAVQTLRDWWGDGRMRAAAVVQTGESPGWLVTHAGLTAGFWRHLGSPSGVESMMTALAAARADESIFRTEGTMLGGSANCAAGPVWAEAGRETCASWWESAEPSPFHQVHGHSSAYNWERRFWRCPLEMIQNFTKDDASRHVVFTHRDRHIVGIDPNHLHEPAPVQQPLLLGAGHVRVA